MLGADQGVGMDSTGHRRVPADSPTAAFLGCGKEPNEREEDGEGLS